MTSWERACKMTLDFVHGASLYDIAKTHDLSPQRVHQIVTKTLHTVGCSGPNVPPEVVGCRLVRHRLYVHEDTPEAVYYWERWSSCS